jgi:hypothetical protein
MSAAFPFSFGSRGAIGGSGGIVAVTLWNYLWQELVLRSHRSQKSVRRSRYLLEFLFGRNRSRAIIRSLPHSHTLKLLAGLNRAPLLGPDSNDAYTNCRAHAKRPALHLSYFQSLGELPRIARRPNSAICLVPEHLASQTEMSAA